MPLHGRKGAGWVVLAATAAAVTIGATVARADVITETVPTVGEEFANIGVNVYVPNFDTALGTLTAASVSLTGQFTPAVVFGFNSPPPPPPPSVQFVNPYIGGDLHQVFGSQTVAYVIGPDGRTATAVGTPEAVDISEPLSVTNLPVFPPDPTYLYFYIVASSGFVSPPNAFVLADHGNLNAQLAVTYTYTPKAAVPEPDSLALLGVGLLGLCAVGAGRRQAASRHSS